MNIKHITYIGFCLLAMGCASPSVPDSYTETARQPKIYPDYTDVTIPINMAPLTFQLDEAADDMIARYAVGDEEIICEGKAQPDDDDWRTLAEKAKGSAITVDVYANKADQWTHYKPFHIYVSPDSIDSYLSYRLIFPSFVSYEALTINQRCLENYDESVIYDNVLCTFEKDGQCINCHNYQQYNPERMQFHARQNQGGTVIAYDGKVRKIDMKNDSILSAGVYPTWHPTLPLIVYSTNKTLYYCSAHFERQDTTLSAAGEITKRSKEIKYNIYKKSFNPETMTFGARQLVFAADSLGKSATLPRISPDGRYLMFALAEFGVFHIWHHDADLWMIDLQTGEARAIDEINSPDTESYHSWSSNGRWVVFASRRDDGTYTRPFFAHVDKDGRATKPFELPSADPDYHRQLMKSYNIPEFMRGPVTIKPQQFADVLKGEGEPVKYVQQLNNNQ